MKSFKRRLVFTTVLLIFFSLRAFSYYQYMNDGNDIETLLEMVTGYAGYNAILIHGSIYTLVFLLGYSMLIQPINVQQLIRNGRKRIVRLYEKQLCLYVLLFVGIFTAVYLLYIIAMYDIQFLVSNYFFIGCGLQFIGTCLVYTFIGKIYIFYYVLMLSKIKAYTLTLITSIVMVTLVIVYQVWLPFSVMDVYDRIYNEGLSIIILLIEYAVTMILLCSLSAITIIKFWKKDILT